MARPSHGGTTWVPLRENYFATPLLSAKEKAYLVRKSCEAAQEVVERARSTGGPIQWRHVEKFQDVQIYAGQPRSAYGNAAQPADIVSMCGVTSVAGTVKEVAALFDLSTTRAMKEFSMANRELFYDAIVLYNLSPRTKERPLHQVTAKWIVVKSPKGVPDDRDFCYLECQDKFVDSHGRKGWVLCLHSIKLPGCDDLTNAYGFVRGSFYHSGLIVVETDRPGYVDVIHMLQMNFKRNTRVSPSFLRDRVAFVAKVRLMMRSKRLNEQRYLSDLELVPKKYRSRCSVCQDSFSLLLLRKMNCRKCGEVVCGACSKEFDVRNSKFLETVKLRICMHCFQLVTTAPTASQQIPMLDPSRASSSTAMSLLGYVDDAQRASFLTQVPSSAAELAETTSAQHRTKIFLQSLQRPRPSTTSRQPSSLNHHQHVPAPTDRYYQGGPAAAPRGSHPLRPSQLGVYPSRGSGLDAPAPPYSRDTASYSALPTQQQQQQQPASIFDRPYTVAPHSGVPHEYVDFQRQSDSGAHYHQHQYGLPDARSRTNTREFATRGDRNSARTQNHSYSSAYEYQQQLGLPLPLPVAYPDSLRGSESKRRDSASSESSADSIDIDADDNAAPIVIEAHALGRDGDRSRSNSRVSAASSPPPPPPYFAVGNGSRSPVSRERSPSHPAPFYVKPSPMYQRDTVVRNDNDDSDDESMGSGDEAEFAEFTAAAESQPSTTGAVTSSMFSGETQTEETAVETAAAATLAQPPASPSAQVATNTALDSIVAASAAVTAGEQSAGTPGERTSEAPEGHSDRVSEHAYDLRDSELGLNTASCDLSFLDSDMRKFHDQSWFIDGARPPVDRSADDSTTSKSDKAAPVPAPAVATMAVAASAVSASPSGLQLAPFRSRQPSTRVSESRATARSSVSKASNLRIGTAFAVARPLLSVSNHVTSPTNSYEGIPSLYAKPRDRKPSVQYGLAHRQGTIALNDMDNDPPPSYASSVSSLKSNDRETVSRHDSSASVSSGSSASSGSAAAGKSKSKTAVVISEDIDAATDNATRDCSTDAPAPSQSFFGAVTDDMPPLYHSPRSMAAFSATATYEVPQRSDAETQELLRKLSSSNALISPSEAAARVSDGGKSEPEHESIASSPSESDEAADGCDAEFGVFDTSILHDSVRDSVGGLGAGVIAPPAASAVPRFQLVPNDIHGPASHVGDDDDEEEDALLSARSLYKSFGNTLKLTKLVGGNPAFQRTFQQIQESIDMLSSDDESNDESDDDGVVFEKRVSV